MINQPKELAIFQTENGAIEIRADIDKDTIWASLEQIALLFGKDKSVISRHIKNIFLQGELDPKVVVAFFATTTQHGAIKGKTQTKKVSFYNLDVILSVGYRVNSKVATKFRQWATQILKQHITEGYTLNTKILETKKQEFLKTLEDLKLLTQNAPMLQAKDVLSLIQVFSHSFFNIDCYDKNQFPKSGSREDIYVSAEEFWDDLQVLKTELIKKVEASMLFAQEKQEGSLKGIFGNVFQSVFGEDAYRSIEEKAAHLLYFIVKDHPFTDGNKRSGAFAFIWLLHKAGYPIKEKISPETLTTLTILIAESNPDVKDKMIGLVLLLLHSDNNQS